MFSTQVIDVIQIISVAVGALLVLVAAVIDVRQFKIPNRISGSLLAVGIIYGLVTTNTDFAWVPNAACAVLMFLVGAVLFQFRLLGGGDVKLLAVVSFWSGIPYLLGFAFYTSIAGGVVSVIYLTHGWLKGRRLKAADPATEFNILKEPVPYGVAIAAGAVYVFLRIIEQLELVVRM